MTISHTFGKPNGTHVDPDLDAAPLASDLDDLRAELLEAPALDDSIDLAVPGRPRYGIRVRLDFTRAETEGWRQRARDKGFEVGFDVSKYNRLVIAGTTTAVLRDGTPLELDGKPVKFTSRELQELLNVDRAEAAVAALFGHRDAGIAAVADKIAESAGWGEAAVELDPTQPRG